MRIFILFILSLIAGIFGRMGGVGKPFRSWMRDWIIPIFELIIIWIYLGFKINYWWIYLLIYSISGISFSTYWDWLFGEDNLWFSGFFVGLSLFPLLWLHIAWWIILAQAFLLAVIWGGLNKWLPKKVLIWRRDTAEEFLRYASRILALIILFL